MLTSMSAYSRVLKNILRAQEKIRKHQKIFSAGNFGFGFEFGSRT